MIGLIRFERMEMFLQKKSLKRKSSLALDPVPKLSLWRKANFILLSRLFICTIVHLVFERDFSFFFFFSSLFCPFLFLLFVLFLTFDFFFLPKCRTIPKKLVKDLGYQTPKSCTPLWMALEWGKILHCHGVLFYFFGYSSSCFRFHFYSFVIFSLRNLFFDWYFCPKTKSDFWWTIQRGWSGFFNPTSFTWFGISSRKQPCSLSITGFLFTFFFFLFQYFEFFFQNLPFQPSQILLTKKGEVKLSDYGSQRIRPTRGGPIFPPYWESPEVYFILFFPFISFLVLLTWKKKLLKQLKLQERDEKLSDVWSLGITAIELAQVFFFFFFTLQPPFKNKTSSILQNFYIFFLKRVFWKWYFSNIIGSPSPCRRSSNASSLSDWKRPSSHTWRLFFFCLRKGWKRTISLVFQHPQNN